MPDVALQYTQSLSQLGVGIAIALLYFIEYQVRICNNVSEALERLRSELDKLQAFDKRRLKQAQESPIELMDGRRRDKSFEQHDDVEQIKTVLKIVNHKMWFHVYNLRRSSDRLFYACLFTGGTSFAFLLIGSSYPDYKIPTSPILLVAVLFATVLGCLVYKIVDESRVVEKTYRRRYIKEGDRLSEDRGPEPKGLGSIVAGDELGVVYFLQRQIEYRVEQIGAYKFSRYVTNRSDSRE